MRQTRRIEQTSVPAPSRLPFFIVLGSTAVIAVWTGLAVVKTANQSLLRVTQALEEPLTTGAIRTGTPAR